MNKITRALVIAITVFCACSAVFAGSLGSGKVTPDTATENSIYTLEVTWKDDKQVWPVWPVPEEDLERFGNITNIEVLTDNEIKFDSKYPAPFVRIRVYEIKGDNKDQNLFGDKGSLTVEGDISTGYSYTAKLSDKVPSETDDEGNKTYSEIGIQAFIAGQLIVEPVQARFDQSYGSGTWRSGKVCYVSHTPMLRDGGLLGVFTSTDLATAERIDSGYHNRHIGRIGLKSEAVVNEPWGSVVDPVGTSSDAPVIYYAYYLTGPVQASIRGRGSVWLAEKDDSDYDTRDGVVYYARISRGLNLANDPTACPGVNFVAGLTAKNTGAPRDSTMDFYTREPGKTDRVEQTGVSGPTVIGSDAMTPSGTVMRLAPSSATQVKLPFSASLVNGIYAEVVTESPSYLPANYIGAIKPTFYGQYVPGVDWLTNYWNGGSGNMILTTGTPLVRMQKVELTPDEWNAEPTQLLLWNGFPSGSMDPKYETLRGALAHVAYDVTGVYLKNRPTGSDKNYFDSFDRYDPNVPESAHYVNFNESLPLGTREIYVQYIPYVRVQHIPNQIPRIVMYTDSSSTEVIAASNQPRHGATRNRDYLYAYSGPGGVTVIDPLIPEAATTSAGNPMVIDPSNPGQTQILRRNVLQMDAPVIDPTDPDNPDEGTGSTPFVFRVVYAHEDNRPPRTWLSSANIAGNATMWADDTKAQPKYLSGVVLYLDAKGIGDYQPYIMAQQDWNDTSYKPVDGGATFYFRVEPASGWSSWITGDGIVWQSIQDNLYVSLLAGRYHYFFGASDDSLRDEEDRLYVCNELPLWRMTDTWTEQHYPPYSPGGDLADGYYSNPYIQVDRATLEPGGGRTGYQFDSREYPRVHPVLMPPEMTEDGLIPSNATLLGSGYFYGTINPYRRTVNPLYDYPHHGGVPGFSKGHNHSGYYSETDPDFYIGYHGIETSGSTTATEHTYRIKYQSKDPITGAGIAPAGGVWVFINNASSAGNAGSTRDSGQYVDPSSPYYYKGYRMQPVAGDPLDYAKGVLYELTKVTLPAGPHTYYFAASDGHRWTRWPVRPDGRWASKGSDAAFSEDPWVPGDEGYADNNDYCPGPYVNHKPTLINAQVTPTSGAQGTDFVFTVNYKDADGQRPYKANLVIELDRDKGITRTVTMSRTSPSVGRDYAERIAEFQNGVEYFFNTASAGDLVLVPGEHRYYFEFTDDWGRQTDPNDRIKGEKVRFPEGDGNWISGPTIVENARPTLSRGSVVSSDGTSTGATLWNFSVNYADANNDAPSYVNLYIGENIESKLVVGESCTPMETSAGNGQFRVIRLASPQVNNVIGVWTTFEDAVNMNSATNLYSGGALLDADTGIITLSEDLPVYGAGEAPAESVGLPKDVYVSYHKREVVWDTGTPMTKVNPNDSVYTDGCLYELEARLGGPEREIAEISADRIEYNRSVSPPSATIRVNAAMATRILNVYDNARLEGYDYYNGYAQMEEILTLEPGSYNAFTKTGVIVAKHGPIDPQRIAGVWKNKQGTGTNYLASLDTTEPTGRTIKLKNLTSAAGPFYVTYYTLFRGNFRNVDAAWSEIEVRDHYFQGSTGFPGKVSIAYVPAAKKYYYAFEASDGKLNAVYTSIIDSVTQEDSKSAGSIEGHNGVDAWAAREYLNPSGSGRYEPYFRGPVAIDPANWDDEGNMVETVLVGKLGSTSYALPKNVIDDPIVYKSDAKNSNPDNVDVRLEKSYVDTLLIDSPSAIDTAGRTIQLSISSIEEEAWVIDASRVQLRHGPWRDMQPKSQFVMPGDQYNPNAIFVWDYNDRNLDRDRRLSLVPASGATFDKATGIIDMGADVLPENVSTVWVRYFVWGGMRQQAAMPTFAGASEIVAIWDSANFRDNDYTGFNYWTCYAEKELVAVQRQTGGVVKAVVTHTPIKQVIGVWDNPNKTGTNYFDSSKQGEFAQGIVYLTTAIPSNVNSVYIEYYAYGDSEFVGQPSVYDPNLGKITLGSKLPDGVRKVWIEFRQNADYRVNYTGRLNTDGTVSSLPSIVFQYDMPSADPALDPEVDPNAYKGYIQADYWFATGLSSSVGYNTPPQLLRGEVKPLEGRTGTDFTYSVEYRDIDGPTGQAPEWVRTIIDGKPAVDMQLALSGTPSYRDGAKFNFVTKLGSGAHNYHFEASDGAGFAFFGNTGSSAANIINLPGPWVNDPPVLSDPNASPNPTNQKLSTLDTVEYLVTYTDIDNDAPDADYPKLWIDNSDRIAYYGTIEQIIYESGTVYDPANPIYERARKMKFTLYAGPKQLVPPTFTVDSFAGKYLQITSGSQKGRLYLILNNNRDVQSTSGGEIVYNNYLTVIESNIIDDGIEPGTKFVIGPITMAKTAGQTDYSQGVQYRTTLPKLWPGDHNFYMSAQTTTYIPLNIGQAFVPPLTTTEERKRVQTAAATTTILGPSVELLKPEGNVAPELTGAVWTQDSTNSDTWTFKVRYRDQNGDAPTYNEAEDVLGYVRVVLTSEDGTRLAADLYPNSWSSDFTSWVEFEAKDIQIRTGRTTFYFEASDGWNRAIIAGPYTLQLNSPPVLRNVTVSPEIGNEWTPAFEYKVNYYDQDGKQSPNVLLHIDGGTSINMEVERINGILPPDSAYGDVSRGVNYVYRATKSEIPGLYTVGPHQYRIVASDGISETEISRQGPTITENEYEPTLSDAVVDPTEGNLTRSYTYKVKYRDPDGDAPIVIDQNGNVTTGMMLFIDRLTTNPNPGADPLGQVMKVDPNWRGGSGNPVPTANDYKSVEGVLFSKVISGRLIGSGTDHYAWIVAWDGKLDGSNREHEARLRLDGPSIRAASITGIHITPSPARLGSTVTISGTLNPIMPDSTDRYVYVKLTRPDGSRFDLGSNAQVATDASGAFQLSFEPDQNMTWQVEVSWPGNMIYERTVETLTFDVAIDTYTLKEYDGRPVIDMISCPLIPTNGMPDAMFGLEEARQMRIQRWSPSDSLYYKFGETYFPALKAGDGMWIYPTLSYPKNGTGLFGEPIRVIAPYGRLHPQNTAFRLPINRGWNQIGSVFLSDLPIENVKVRYQSRDLTLSEAAAAGILRDYMWGWDSLRNPESRDNYFLVHATRAGAEKNLKPWKGYWIRSFMDVDLILYPPVPGALSVQSSDDDSSPASARHWEGLDQPPASP